MRQVISRTALLIAGTLLALALAGCVESSGPILAENAPVFGPRLKLQFYALRNGYAGDPQQANYTWNGNLYAHAGGGMREVSGFSIHPFEAGDYIIQTVSSKRIRISEFALLHRLAEGVWQVVPIDEADADQATRAAYCSKAGSAPCNIATREQLFAFARATAARRHDNGGLVIRLPDGSRQQPSRQPRR